MYGPPVPAWIIAVVVVVFGLALSAPMAIVAAKLFERIVERRWLE